MKFHIWNPNQSVVRLFFDILHGIDRADIPLVVALEFAILLGYDGQLKQDSDLEKELFQTTIDQLKKTKMTKAGFQIDAWSSLFYWIIFIVHLFNWFEAQTSENQFENLSKLENALMWLYIKSWGLKGQHVIDESLWNFGGEDLENAIMKMAYPRKKPSASDETENGDNLIDSLENLIMGKFDEKKDEFYKWSQTIHQEVRVIHKK